MINAHKRILAQGFVDLPTKRLFVQAIKDGPTSLSCFCLFTCYARLRYLIMSTSVDCLRLRSLGTYVLVGFAHLPP